VRGYQRAVNLALHAAANRRLLPMVPSPMNRRARRPLATDPNQVHNRTKASECGIGMARCPVCGSLRPTMADSEAVPTNRDPVADADSVDSASRQTVLPWRTLVGMTLQEIETQHITATLRHTGGNITEAAFILGIDRSTVYAKLKRHQISRP
jgi:DNA-binding NtrC family response regulator